METGETEMIDFNAIAKDLDACDLGIALTRGKLRARYVAHRKNCMAAIKAENAADGLNGMTDDELLAELAA
jgi:hypothetical protein